jgi:hypothetical protein
MRISPGYARSWGGAIARTIVGAMLVGFGPGLALAETNVEATQQIATATVLRIIGSFLL